MKKLHVVKNQNENGVYYSVLTENGMPINYGHFTKKSDADEVVDILTNGGFTVSSDQSGNVCQSMDSWIEV